MFKFSTLFALFVTGMFLYIFYPVYVAIHNSLSFIPQ